MSTQLAPPLLLSSIMPPSYAFGASCSNEYECVNVNVKFPVGATLSGGDIAHVSAWPPGSGPNRRLSPGPTSSFENGASANAGLLAYVKAGSFSSIVSVADGASFARPQAFTVAF